jgi:hypothetical protein
LCLLPCVAWSQETRLKDSIESRLTTPLAGHIHPLAQAQYDHGPADAPQWISPLTLVLKRSAEQQEGLARLLQEQQDPASSQYHRWLTPAEFGQRFGFSQGDIKAVSTWLVSQGFTIVDVPPSRNLIVFRGTVEAVQSAFRTSIHEYVVEGERHIANSTAPSVPAALEPLVLAITGLHDFHPRATPIPNITFGDGSHNVGPADYAVIYDTLPLNQAGFTGLGEKIAVVGQCNIALADVQKFRTFFSLPANNPQFILAAGSADPGPKGTNPGDCDEAYLDVEWSGGIASAATIEYVYAKDVFFAVQYAITHNIGNVVSMSFGGCEQDDSPNVGTSNQALAQQGNAQGITWVASSGDSGAAGCDAAFSKTALKATKGLAVNFPASIPEVTAVGGTQFNEGSGMYWSSTTGAGDVSALSYIPEAAWNESGSSGLASSGGGLSTFFKKPVWQMGPGVPAQNQRAVPDVSLTAALHDGYYSFSGGQAFIFYGTSAATPAFAAILAILDQYQVSKGFQAKRGQGNINPKLYQFSQSAPSAFHDVTSGNNIVPCTTGSTNCTTGSLGYSAGPGYDLVTGLGSVDVNNLTLEWSGQTVTPPPITVIHKLTSNISGSNSCGVPPQVTNFTTQSAKVWLFFDVTGAKVGDSAQISFFRPDGTLFTNIPVPVSAVGTNGSECFSTSIDVANAPAAAYPGTWSIEVFWDQSATPLFTLNFTLSSPGQPPTKQIFPHIASDNEWHTDVFVLNTSSTSATFSLVFHTDTGAPMPLNGNPVTSNVILAPGGMAFFRTAPATGSNNGWAELDSNVALTGVVVYGRHASNGSYYEASAPLSSPYASFTVPFDETVSPLGSAFLNAFALANTDPSNSAQVTCTAYATGGNVLGGLQVGPLSPLQHTEFLLGSSFAGQRGTLVCQSTTLVAAVELRAFSSSPAVSSMPVITGTASVAQGSNQIFPHIASDAQWHTDIFVLNPNSTAANFSLVFHTDTAGAAMPLDGNPQTSNVALPPNGMAFFRTSPAATSNNAWAELDSSAALSGVVVYGRHGADGSYYEASAPLSSPYSSFTVPFDETVSLLGLSFLNAFALANTDPVNSAQVSCTPYGAGGNLLGAALQVGPLSPLQHTEFLIGSSLAGQRGTLVCHSTTRVAAVELRAISSSPAISSLPVIPSAGATLPAAANRSE